MHERVRAHPRCGDRRGARSRVVRRARLLPPPARTRAHAKPGAHPSRLSPGDGARGPSPKDGASSRRMIFSLFIKYSSDNLRMWRVRRRRRCSTRLRRWRRRLGMAGARRSSMCLRRASARSTSSRARSGRASRTRRSTCRCWPARVSSVRAARGHGSSTGWRASGSASCGRRCATSRCATSRR